MRENWAGQAVPVFAHQRQDEFVLLGIQGTEDLDQQIRWEIVDVGLSALWHCAFLLYGFFGDEAFALFVAPGSPGLRLNGPLLPCEGLHRAWYRRRVLARNLLCVSGINGHRSES